MEYSWTCLQSALLSPHTNGNLRPSRDEIRRNHRPNRGRRRKQVWSNLYESFKKISRLLKIGNRNPAQLSKMHQQRTKMTMKMKRIVVAGLCKETTMILRNENEISVIVRRRGVIPVEGGRRNAMRESRIVRIVNAEDSLVKAMGPNHLVRNCRSRCDK